jgi:hypothetical protein
MEPKVHYHVHNSQSIHTEIKIDASVGVEFGSENEQVLCYEDKDDGQYAGRSPFV